MKRIIVTAAMVAAGIAGQVALIELATADEGRDRTPPCKFEDGSGQVRCVWDARHMGNGQGQSLLIKRGGEDDAEYIRISHRRAHRLMTTLR